MTDNQLATMSTLIWLAVTTVLFIELANWSAGGSWTIVPGLVRGARGWILKGQEPDLPPLAISPHSSSAATAAATTAAATFASPAPGAGQDLASSILAWRSRHGRAPDVVVAYIAESDADIVELEHSELPTRRVSKLRRR